MRVRVRWFATLASVSLVVPILMSATSAQAAGPTKMTVTTYLTQSYTPYAVPPGAVVKGIAVTASPAEVWAFSYNFPNGCIVGGLGAPFCNGTWSLTAQSGDALNGDWASSSSCSFFWVTGGSGRFAGASGPSAREPQFPYALGHNDCTLSASEIPPLASNTLVPLGVLNLTV